jgi:hypothetical protein
MNAKDISQLIEVYAGLSNRVFVPEYTWGDLRIDAIEVDARDRSVHGYEIKVNRSDWTGDAKWQQYSQFCSTLSVVCPAGLIEPAEVPKPFGLLHVSGHSIRTVQRARRFNKKDLAWTWTYLRVIEREMPRLVAELGRARSEIERYRVNSVAQEVS